MTEDIVECIEVLKCNISILEHPDVVEGIIRRHNMEQFFKVDNATNSVIAERGIYLDDNVYFFLAELSNVAYGYILFLREYEVGVVWELHIKDGKVTESCADLNFKEMASLSLPKEVAEKRAVVNERYIATSIDEPYYMIIGYDLKKNRWIVSEYSMFSLEDLSLFKKMSDMEDVPDNLYTSQPPSFESLIEFTQKILKEFPEVEQKLKKVLVADLV